MNSLVEWLSQHLLTCPSKYVFHIDCPGCGMQRSVVALLEGDFVKSIQLYPATIPIFLCLIFTALHLKFDFKRGAVIVKLLFILSASIVTTFYIYKIFTLKII